MTFRKDDSIVQKMLGVVRVELKTSFVEEEH